MPLHDYQCEVCGHIQEELMPWDNRHCVCRECQGPSTRVYLSFNGMLNTAPDWLKSTLEVVDKDGGSHCQEFLKHPNKSNYKNWMKGEGLRPYDIGEGVQKPKIDTSGIRKKVKEKFRKDNTITINSGEKL